MRGKLNPGRIVGQESWSQRRLQRIWVEAIRVFCCTRPPSRHVVDGENNGKLRDLPCAPWPALDLQRRPGDVFVFGDSLAQACETEAFLDRPAILFRGVFSGITSAPCSTVLLFNRTNYSRPANRSRSTLVLFTLSFHRTHPRAHLLSSNSSRDDVPKSIPDVS
jgi:hypothetical protein